MGYGFAILLAILLTAWAVAALYFDLLPGNLKIILASAYAIAMLAALLVFRRGGIGIEICVVAFALVFIWWLTLKLSNDRAWQPDVAQTAWAEIEGDQLPFTTFATAIPNRRRLHPALGDAVG